MELILLSLSNVVADWLKPLFWTMKTGSGKSTWPYSDQWKKSNSETQCCCSVTKSCPTPCDPKDCSMPGLPVPRYISWSLNKFTSTESVMLSNHLPSIFPNIGETQSRISKRDPLSPPGRCSIWIWVCSRHLVTIRGVWSCQKASCKSWKLSHH